MFNIGKTDQYGRQKRIEHRGKYLRASRTGGVSLRAQTKAAGLNVTGNTKRGIRLSTRAAKGTNVAFQNGRFRLRGRYGKGPTKLNLSKSGMSVSTRNALGTFNWTKPNRSSAKIAGVQMRGKKAANLQLIYLVVMLVVNLVKLAAILLVGLAQALVVIARAVWIGSVSGTQALI
ncbi:MAG: DNA-binding protein, partial [Spirochaetia bacterium]